MQIAKKILAILLAMLMVFSTFAVGGAGLALTASAAETGKAIRLVSNGKADYIKGAQTSSVWFGNYMQSSADSKESVKWRVLENKDGKLFLLADQNLDVVRYNEERIGVTWADCTLRKWLNGYSGNPYSDSFIGSAFSEKELTAVADSEVENANNPEYNTNGGNDTTDKVFLLSIAEAMNTDYGFTDNYYDTDKRVSTNTQYVANGGHTGGGMYGVGGGADYWWLRSPGNYDFSAAFVYYVGRLDDGGGCVDYDSVTVRPAFKMNLNSVLFTSAAENGKQGDVALTAVETYTGSDWKLTVLDDSRSGFKTRCTAIENGVYTITYSGAKTGENEMISAMIVDADGVVTYYGVLENAKAGENTLTLDVSGKLSDGDKLYVFNEQVNGDKKTDYASDLQDVTELFRYKTGDTILYGNYPQSEVPQTDALKAAAETSAWRSFGDYSGDCDGYYFTAFNADYSMKQGDFFRYADFTLDGVNYRAVRFDEYRPRAPFMVRDAAHSMQDENGYAPNTVYYFKYEPIEWRVLDPDKGLVMCNTALDSRASQNYVKVINSVYYGDDAGTVWASDWEHSELRAWLNEDFLRTAFTAAQRANIAETTINNENYKTLTGSPSAEHPDGAATTDRVFLLSYADVIDPAYGFDADPLSRNDARQIVGSNYAKCRGLYVTSADLSQEGEDGIHSYWYTRTASTDMLIGTIYPRGFISDTDMVVTDQGVVPAMTLTEIRDDVEYDPIEPPVCRIGDTYYATIGEAIDDVTADGTVITILRDCEFDGLTEVAGYDITLESGERGVTVTLTGAMKFGKNDQKKTFTLRGNSTADTTLTIKPKLTDGTNAFRPIAVRQGNTLIVETGVILEGSRFTTGNGGMVNVAKGATLKLNGGTIRDCSAIRGGAVYVVGNGVFYITDGKIENCTAEQGGAVYLTNNSICSFTGGSIENCTAKHRTEATEANSAVSAAGGAVYTIGMLLINGGTIKNCTAECGKGGGVYIYPESGSCIMSRGMITGCKATENADADLYYNDGRGGGVYVGKTKDDTYGLVPSGGSITGNTAKEGGGVYLHEDAVMLAAAGAYIYENADSNVYVSDSANIQTLMENDTYALTGNAKIGVTTRTEPTIGAPVIFGSATADCTEYFVSDLQNIDVVYDADNEALLLQCIKKAETPAATFSATGYDTGTLTGLTAGMTYAVNGGTPVTATESSVTFTDIALPFVIKVVQPGDGKTTLDSDPQTIELTRADAPALEATQPEKTGDKGSIPTTSAHQKSTDGSSWTDCAGDWTNLDGGKYYVRTKPNGTVLASEAQEIVILSDPQLVVTVTATTQKEETVVTATLAEGATGTVTFALDGKEYTANVQNNKAQLRLTLGTGSYSLTASYSGDDTFFSAETTATFTVACAHEWEEPTWNWEQDVNNPTYSTTCTLCSGTASGSVKSDPGKRVAATVDNDAFTPYTATVTLDSQTFTDKYDKVEAGTMLAARKAAFDAYKDAQKKAADDKALDGDSDACKQLIEDAKTAIDNVQYNEAKPLADNKKAVDDAANLAGLDKALADQRAADAVEDKIDSIGDVTLTDESKQKIDDARKAYDALTDEQKALVDNVDKLTAAEAELADREAFEAYKEGLNEAIDALAKDGDSAAAQKIIADAKDELDALGYDDALTLDENKAAADAVYARAKAALEAQRFADCPLCGKGHEGGCCDKLLGFFHRLIYRLQPYAGVFARILQYILEHHVIPLLG